MMEHRTTILRRAAGLALFAVVIASGVAQAQIVDDWVSARGPWGGNVTTIIEPESGLLLAATDDGVYRSSLSLMWERATGIPPSVSVVALAAAPGGRYYAGTSNGGIFRSLDRGAIWERIGTTLPSTFWNSVAVNPLREEILASGGEGVYRSTDLGLTWLATGETRVLYALAFLPSGEAIASLPLGGIMRSDDSTHSTWTLVDTVQRGVSSIALSGSTLWASTRRQGVYRSSDKGTTWTRKDTIAATCVATGIANAQEQVLVGYEDGSVAMSTNDGDTWEILTDTNRHTPAQSLLRGSDGNLLESTGKGPYRQDSPSGTTWSFAGQGIENGLMRTVIVRKGLSGEALYAAQYTGQTHAATIPVDGDWSDYVDREFQNFPRATVAGMAMDSVGALYLAVSYEQIFRSGEGNVGWIAAGAPSRRSYQSIAINAEGTILVGADSGYVFRSLDGGSTWETHTVGTSGNVLAIAVRGETVWAATDKGLYRSMSGGRDFLQMGPTAATYSIALGPDNSLYVGSYSGRVYRSSDGGATWNYSVVAAANPFVNAVAVNGRGDVFAAGMPDGMYRSTDGGATWSVWNRGLTSKAITTIAFDAEGRAYAGTYGAGIFVTVESTTGVEIENVPDVLDLTAIPTGAHNVAGR